MGKVVGFKTHKREHPLKRPVDIRLKDYREIYGNYNGSKAREQAARCMDCGVPFCHLGCPLGNIIPEWNDLVYQHRWKEAYQRLDETNNFPEFTGRLRPAPCEASCVLGIIDPPVSIEHIEKAIIEHAFKNGWVQPIIPKERSGKRVAVVGSGPAGLAAAQQLNRAGHWVTVYEKSNAIGGLLRYGIPDFKMEKHVLDRRIDILVAEGITFTTAFEIGVDISVEALKKTYDALVLCTGAQRPRNLANVPGQQLDGIHYAMEYLTQQNRICNGEDPLVWRKPKIEAAGKHVIVIGGGDTASDCIGTANRQGAASIVNFEFLPKPPEERPDHQPWPLWPNLLRTSSSHEEGCRREWNILTREFIGEAGHVKQVGTVDVEWLVQDKQYQNVEIPGIERFWPADLVLIAVGFTGTEKQSWLDELGVTIDERGNICTDDNYCTINPNVFAAGDSRKGASLIVWAISEGREAARAIDCYLMGSSTLPTKGNRQELPRV